MSSAQATIGGTFILGSVLGAINMIVIFGIEISHSISLPTSTQGWATLVGLTTLVILMGLYMISE